jgi:hypothetical protein
VRHRQTKGAATDMFDLQPPRHISTLRLAAGAVGAAKRPVLAPFASFETTPLNRRVGGELPFPICLLSDAHKSKAVYRVKRGITWRRHSPRDAASARDRRRRPARSRRRPPKTRAARAPVPAYNTPLQGGAGQ